MTTSETVTGWVLHSRPFRNSSLILDVLTAEHGRLGVVARGGRKDPVLQPFRPVVLTVSGRTELRSLRKAEPAAPALSLSGESLYCGLYLNELLVRMLHRDDPQPELVGFYRETLEGLSRGEQFRDVLLRLFEFRLLDLLGYGFSLEQDVEGRLLEDGARYQLSVDEGLRRDVRGDLSGALMRDMAAGNWTPEVRRQARELMRRALAPHLGDRPLASRELFRGAARNTGESE